MTVIELVWEELKEFRKETGERLETIESEVKRTNGRVTTLEDGKKVTGTSRPSPFQLATMLVNAPMFWVYASVATMCVTFVGVLPEVVHRVLTKWGF